MASLVQILGAVAITAGAGLLLVPAGLIVGGVFALAAGLSLEKRSAG